MSVFLTIPSWTTHAQSGDITTLSYQTCSIRYFLSHCNLPIYFVLGLYPGVPLRYRITPFVRDPPALNARERISEKEDGRVIGDIVHLARILNLAYRDDNDTSAGAEHPARRQQDPIKGERARTRLEAVYVWDLYQCGRRNERALGKSGKGWGVAKFSKITASLVCSSRSEQAQLLTPSKSRLLPLQRLQAYSDPARRL